MAVSRKVDRHAVGRNRIKRVIRESFRRSFESMVEGNYPGIDIVVLPRRQAATICNQQLFQSLQTHWSRLKQAEG
jgi:ribonuclease P protein component